MYINGFLIKKSFLYSWHTGHTRRFGKGINTDFIRSNGSLYPVSDGVLMVQDIKDFTLRQYAELLITPDKIHDHAIEITKKVKLLDDGCAYYWSGSKKIGLPMGTILYVVRFTLGKQVYFTKWGAKVSFVYGTSGKECTE